MAADTESRIAALENKIADLEDRTLLQAFELEALETTLAHLSQWPQVDEPLTVLRAEKRVWLLRKIDDLAETSPQIAARIRKLAAELMD